jgi:hypothetical protein
MIYMAVLIHGAIVLFFERAAKSAAHSRGHVDAKPIQSQIQENLFLINQTEKVLAYMSQLYVRETEGPKPEVTCSI